jgi:hypothetical protein
MVKGITHIIKNDSNCQTLIGLNAAGTTVKVYPVISTQGEALPLVSVSLSGREPEFCRGQRPTTFNYSYEVNVYAGDYDEAEAIMDAVIDALEDKDVSSPVNGVQFTDRIRNVNSLDGNYIEEYKAYNRVGRFEAPVNESPAT